MNTLTNDKKRPYGVIACVLLELFCKGGLKFLFDACLQYTTCLGPVYISSGNEHRIVSFIISD